MGGLTFFYTTGNDAAIETIANMSLYAHWFWIGIYSVHHFKLWWFLEKRTGQWFRFCTSPRWCSFTFRFCGSIAMLAFILYISWLRPPAIHKARAMPPLATIILTATFKWPKATTKNQTSVLFRAPSCQFCVGNIDVPEEWVNASPPRLFECCWEPANAASLWMRWARWANQPFKRGYLKTNWRRLSQKWRCAKWIWVNVSKTQSTRFCPLLFSIAAADGLTESTGQLNALGTAVTNNLFVKADSVSNLLDQDAYGPLTMLTRLPNHSVT